MSAPVSRLAATAAALLAVACTPIDQPAAVTTAAPLAVADPAAAQTALAAIPVRDFHGRHPSYRRDAFGDAWSDAGSGIEFARNGCDTRNDILRRDAQPGTVRLKPNTGECKVTGGSWVSPYTGVTIVKPSALDIDHIVPLSRAWAAGASQWPAQQRLNFANDPENLVAADRASNRSKSDLGPGAWRPRRPYQCNYAVRYIRATAKYRLPLTPADTAALRSMLSTCPNTP